MEQASDDRSYSLLDIERFAEREGLRLRSYRAIDKREIKSNRNYPIILILNDGSSLHAVLLIRRVFSYYLLYDPSRGKRWVSFSELLESWNGEYLSGSVFKKKCYRRKGKIKKGNMAISIAFKIGSFLALVSCFITLNLDVIYIYPIILFVLYVISETSSKIWIRAHHRSIDMKIADSSDKVGSNCGLYRLASSYKFNELGFFFGLVDGVIISCSIVLFSLLRDPNSLFNFLSLTLGIFSLSFIFRRFEKREEERIRLGETSIEEKRGPSFANAYMELSRAIERLASIYYIKKTLAMLLSLTLALIFSSLDSVIYVDESVLNIALFSIYSENLFKVSDYFYKKHLRRTISCSLENAIR